MTQVVLQAHNLIRQLCIPLVKALIELLLSDAIKAEELPTRLRKRSNDTPSGTVIFYITFLRSHRLSPDRAAQTNQNATHFSLKVSERDTRMKNAGCECLSWKGLNQHDPPTLGIDLRFQPRTSSEPDRRAIFSCLVADSACRVEHGNALE